MNPHHLWHTLDDVLSNLAVPRDVAERLSLELLPVRLLPHPHQQRRGRQKRCVQAAEDGSDTGWDLAYLSYSLPDPLKVIVDQQAQDDYLRLFQVPSPLPCGGRRG